jgi:hypothetical protein
METSILAAALSEAMAGRACNGLSGAVTTGMS